MDAHRRVLAECCKARNEPESLVRLVMKLQNCFIALTQMNYEVDLNTVHTLEAIVRCLRADIQQQWAEEAVIIGRMGKEPNITELTKFTQNRAEVASSHFGQLASISRQERHHTKERTYEIPRGSRIANNYATLGERRTMGCPMCRSNHELSACEEFMQLAIPDRGKAAKRYALDNVPETDRASGALNLTTQSLPHRSDLGGAMERGVRRVHFSTKAAREESHPTRAAIVGIQRIRPARVCRAVVVAGEGPPSRTLSKKDRVGSTLRPAGPDGLRSMVDQPQSASQGTKGKRHLFSDASETGYVRWQHMNGERKTELLFTKVRVASLKCVSIPRLELTAAVPEVRIAKQLRQCFRIFEDRVTFWTDSAIVM
ncbi:unnamed protein product [Echinostoma caproni]|uniref:Uncharacterized protein n=1 Tax=Echinostoma caproni TaxID=27848 RepID=A0A183B1X9_9TREM|nr:unnamed protein product [Echinostoma caproni]